MIIHTICGDVAIQLSIRLADWEAAGFSAEVAGDKAYRISFMHKNCSHLFRLRVAKPDDVHSYVLKRHFCNQSWSTCTSGASTARGISPWDVEIAEKGTRYVGVFRSLKFVTTKCLGVLHIKQFGCRKKLLARHIQAVPSIFVFCSTVHKSYGQLAEAALAFASIGRDPTQKTSGDVFLRISIKNGGPWWHGRLGLATEPTPLHARASL